MLKRTQFFETHKAAGAKLIDFGGFEMPVQYSGILKEHEAVRTSAGIFDVSHMGEIFVKGPNALDLVQFATVNDVRKLTDGKIQYSAMCYENGGIVDDLLVYKIADENYMLVVNASNKDKDLSWLLELNKNFGATIEDESDSMCLLAVQGPKSVEILQKLTKINLSEITFYTFETGSYAGYDDVILSATGYTGEKGFEIYFDSRKVDSAKIWDFILEAGFEKGILPAGLGARDTLRLEMGFALYGNDISKETTPLEAGLGWVTKLDKGNFCGRDALLAKKETGVKRKLTGFTTTDKRAIPRSGYILKNEEGRQVGTVTSGGKSPTLGIGIGMAYVDVDEAVSGTKVFIEIRNNLFPAIIDRPPFLKRK